MLFVMKYPFSLWQFKFTSRKIIYGLQIAIEEKLYNDSPLIKYFYWNIIYKQARLNYGIRGVGLHVGDIQ